MLWWTTPRARMGSSYGGLRPGPEWVRAMPRARMGSREYENSSPRLDSDRLDQP